MKKKIALLIDYDNFNNLEYFPVLFKELQEEGDILVKYAYYSNLNDPTIKTKFIELGIEPVAQLSYSSGKNATDIRITMEAMELLNKDYIDTFCLATNDADFTPLVNKLKFNNKSVFGAGNKLASTPFKNACDRFIDVERIIDANKPIKQVSTQNKKLDKQFNELIEKTKELIINNDRGDGYADFSLVMLKLNNDWKDFNPKNYRFPTNRPLAFFKNDPHLTKVFLIESSGETSNVITIKPQKGATH